MKQIDTVEVNRGVDLLALAGRYTTLTDRPVARTGGGEYAGPCPFCGGRDRFRVQPNNRNKPIWLCRNCTEAKWKDPIAFVRRLDPGLTFREACKRLYSGQLPRMGSPRPALAPQLATAPPSLDWQAAGITFIEACERELWRPSGAKALAWLRARGLRDETIKRFHLGYNPVSKRIAWEPGVERWTDRGITIPCIAKGALWYIKVRRPIGDPKYRLVSGSEAEAVYNADDLPDYPVILMVEGEFDAALCWQDLRLDVPVGTMGAAGYAPDLATWGRFFYQKSAVMLCYDNDEAGKNGEAALASVVKRHKSAPLPAGPWKDVTDYFLAGGDLWAWIKPYLDQYDPV